MKLSNIRTTTAVAIKKYDANICPTVMKCLPKMTVLPLGLALPPGKLKVIAPPNEGLE